jgi:hypothetical protein
MNTNLRASVIAFLVLVSAFATIASKALSAELVAPRIVIEKQRGPAEPATALGHIDIRFEPAVGTQIDISSFQVLYQFGVFRKDITARILPFVTLTTSGLTGVVPPNLPSGTHTLIVRIRDSQGRTSEQEMKFHVGNH